MTRTLIAAALLSLPAFASETYPGANCVAQSGTATFDTDGHAENASSSTTLALICPIVDPDPTATSSAAAIWVTDLHYSSNVCCDARTKNTGSSVAASASTCSSGSSSSYQGLSPTPIASSYTFTHKFYYCSVPVTYSSNKSEVRSYRY